jgi:hypothetical protein
MPPEMVTQMFSIVWPSSLPQRPTVGGYLERFADTVLRTAMEAGAAKTRRRFTAAPRQIEVTFRVNAAQAAIFKSFFEETTAGGPGPRVRGGWSGLPMATALGSCRSLPHF